MTKRQLKVIAIAADSRSLTRRRFRLALCCGMFILSIYLLFFASTLAAQQSNELEAAATWQAQSDSEIRARFFEWIRTESDNRQPEDVSNLTIQLEALWPATTDEQARFESKWADHIILALPILAPELADPLAFLGLPRRTSAAPNLKLDELGIQSSFLSAQLHLLYGRWLAQNGFYDEAQSQLADLTIESVVDPAMLLFYRGIVDQRLLAKEESLGQLKKLLENAAQIPDRYRHLAEIAIQDLEPLETDTLDEIARLMEDIQRRQKLHRSGTKVQTQEDEVLAKLDKMIEELEEQLQQSQQSQAGNLQPSQAMQQSQRAGGTGPGNVDRKEKTSGKNWGNLDAKDREAALAELAKDLPAHYREVIEEYFRRLAESDKN